MSAVTEYVDRLVSDVEGVLDGPLDTTPARARMVELHTYLRSTIKSKSITDEQRERLDAVLLRLLVEGFGIDTVSKEKR